jgi:hypothetical protein
MSDHRMVSPFSFTYSVRRDSPNSRARSVACAGECVRMSVTVSSYSGS